MTIDPHTVFEDFVDEDGNHWFTMDFPLKCQVCGVVFERQTIGDDTPAAFESIERECQLMARCPLHEEDINDEKFGSDY
jgi:hypothetical protein